jgi:cell division protein FtsW
MLLLIICTLLIFGLLMVHSASWEYSLVGSNSPTRIFQRQLQWLAVGGIIAVMLAWVDYRRWQKYALWAMGGTILLLLSVLLVGEKRLGAVRSLFSGSGQPSELAKLMVVIYLSVWLYSKRDRLGEIGFGLLPMSAILGIVGGLIFLQPDFSAVATIVFLGGILFFLAGGDIRQIGLLVLGTIFIGALVVTLTPTGRERVLSYLGGLRDLTLASDHVRRSIEAFVRGGWFGVGIGKSVTKLTTLPVPHTDSIFAVVGEETGVLGSSFLVLMYGLMLWRGMLIARSAPDGLGRLLAAGLTVWLAMEAFINMAVMVGLLPFAGNALPFISAGGSNLIVSLAAVGILLNISRVSEKRREIEEKFFSAVVDLRRRYWRRSIPSTRRIASSDAKK